MLNLLTVGLFPMKSGVIMLKSGGKFRFVPDSKLPTSLYFEIIDFSRNTNVIYQSYLCLAWFLKAKAWQCWNESVSTQGHNAKMTQVIQCMFQGCIHHMLLFTIANYYNLKHSLSTTNDLFLHYSNKDLYWKVNRTTAM